MFHSLLEIIVHICSIKMVCLVTILYVLSVIWNTAYTFPQQGPGPVETSIRRKLTDQLKPVHLEVVNEAFKHNAPPGSEAHFWLKVVSPLFSEMSLLKRHQTINEILKEELENCIHALTIVARSPEQWDEERGITPPPICQGDGVPD